MIKIKLTKNQLELFEQGHKITDSNNKEFMMFPYWIAKTEKDDIYELYSSAELPIDRPKTYSGLKPNKYTIYKTDGSKIDPFAWYFVLRVDEDVHAQKAALAYALSCKKDNINLALELIDKVFSYNPQKLQTSQTWDLYNPFIIKDPDGWDRNNYEYSWLKELITWNEFQDRVAKSTIGGIKP